MTDDAPDRQPDSRLARRLGLGDAVVVGLGAMLGAGVFAAAGPAAQAAGPGLMLALLVAAVVAYCNAASSARLAAVHPESGGTYVYGRRQLGPFWGFQAGWAFVVGKTASCAAMALTFGAYAWPERQRPLAIAAVVALTAINYRGVRRTAAATRVIIAVVLLALATVVAASLLGGAADPSNLTPVTGDGGARGLLQAAGLLFFAFAGYARIATLGEEVVDPARTIPRAIPIALGITLAVYAAVYASALLAAGAEGLAGAEAPLAEAVGAGRLDALAPAVRVGATVACLGVLLSLLAGTGRTAFAMASNADLPRALDAVHARHRIPHRAELVIAALVCATVAVGDIRGAIGFSSFGVLAYYAIANASAWTLSSERRGRQRAVAALGVVGCVTLAFSLPAESVAAGAGVLAVGAVAYGVRAAVRRRGA